MKATDFLQYLTHLATHAAAISTERATEQTQRQLDDITCDITRAMESFEAGQAAETQQILEQAEQAAYGMAQDLSWDPTDTMSGAMMDLAEDMSMCDSFGMW